MWYNGARDQLSRNICMQQHNSSLSQSVRGTYSRFILLSYGAAVKENFVKYMDRDIE
jgi:hypothetical protein